MNYRMTPVNIPPPITTLTHPEMIIETKVESDVEQDNGEDLVIKGNEVTELYENDPLFSYLPDNGYNPDSMKQDGFYPENLSWGYGDLSSKLTPPSDLYNGPGPKLHP